MQTVCKTKIICLFIQKIASTRLETVSNVEIIQIFYRYENNNKKGPFDIYFHSFTHTFYGDIKRNSSEEKAAVQLILRFFFGFTFNFQFRIYFISPSLRLILVSFYSIYPQ
jgi:hypothetical protein